MKKYWLAIILAVLIVLPLIIAPTYRNSNPINLRVACTNNGTFCTSSAVCNATVINPESLILKNGIGMTQINSLFNVTLLSNQTTINGDYEFTMCCTDGGSTNCNTLSFEVTPNGSTSDVGLAIFYLGGIALLLIFMGFAVYGWAIADKIHIKYIMFVCFWVVLIMLFYISWTGSANYLASLSGIGLFFKWGFYITIFATLPITLGSFAYLVYMAITIPELQRMMKHGVSQEEAEERRFRN